MAFFQWLLLCGITLITTLSFAGQQVHYDPEIVNLSGIIQFKTYPGPPNYTDVKKGDAREESVYLKLNHPIDVAVNQGVPQDDLMNIPEKNVRSIQLVINQNPNPNLIKEGEHVTVTGTLFHGHTGHHHTAVLMEVKSVNKPAK